MRFVLLVTLLLSAAAFSAEAPYYRFWRGVKRDVPIKDSGKTFNQLVNEWLIPATTSCCAATSLVAYLPVLLPDEEQPAGLPDEVALVVYSSEEAYKKTREDKSNAEAIAYGPLHGEVFDMEKSSSVVPGAYSGKAEAGAAYDILGTAVDWQKGYTVFRIALLNQKRDLEKHFSNIKVSAPKLNLLGYTVLVTKDYTIEYQNWLDRAAWKAHYHRVSVPDGKTYVELVAKELKQLPSEKELRYTPLGFKGAGTVIFPIGKKPSPAFKR